MHTDTSVLKINRVYRIRLVVCKADFVSDPVEPRTI